MSEIKSSEKTPPVISNDVNPKADGAQVNPSQAPRIVSVETPKTSAPHIRNTDATQAAPPSPAETKPTDMPPQPILKPRKPQYNWILIPFIFLLLFILVLFIVRPRHKKDLRNLSATPQNIEEKADLSNYSAFVAKNQALKNDKYSESVLTDEPYAGQAPLAVRSNGPLISPEIDPQLAALAEAFKIRLQFTQGSQLLSRGRTVVRVTRGDFRGFKVNAIENLENGIAVSEELTVTTPQNGLIKTINRVLEEVQRTDFSRINSELQNVGMEFSLLPTAPDKKLIHVGLRPVRNWGKPIPGELLIAGKSVGGIMLGMPVNLIKSKLDASFNVLKRKVLVNDVYFDVYKITGRGDEPLLYVYDKDGLVWGISIVSEIFKTERGIGIGSPLDLIRLNYSSIILANSDKKPPFIRIFGVDGIFIVQADGGKKVVSILIGQSPEFE